jgi:hypothetical protein
MGTSFRMMPLDGKEANASINQTIVQIPKKASTHFIGIGATQTTFPVK